MVDVKIIKNGNGYMSKFIQFKNRCNKLEICELSQEKGYIINNIEMSDWEWKRLKTVI